MDYGEKYSHHCKECGEPVARAKYSSGDIGSLKKYGGKDLCLSCLWKKRRARARELKEQGIVSDAEVEEARPSNEYNVMALEAYLNRRRERLGRNGRVA